MKIRFMTFTFVKFVVAVILSGIIIFSPKLQIGLHADSNNLDTNFGNSGIVFTSVGSFNDVASSVIIQPDHKILAVGYSFKTPGSDGTQSSFSMVRYNINGSLDTLFGTGGKVISDFGGGAIAFASVQQQDGKIVVGGYFLSGGVKQWIIARYNSNGTLDTTFGNSGKVITSIKGYSFNNLCGLALQSDGKLVGVGYGYNSFPKDDVQIARFNSDGSFDASFGTDGQVTTAIGAINDRGYKVAVRPNGKIVVCGDYNAGGRDNVFLAQYNPDGSLDANFGSGGKMTISLGENDGGRDLAIQPDGKIVVTGATTINGRANLFLVRFDTNDSLDTNFGTAGTVISELTSGNSVSNAVAIKSDGKIVTAGYLSDNLINNSPGSFTFNSPNDSDIGLIQYNSDGTTDSSFGINGKLQTHIGNGWASGLDLAIQDNNQIVVVGDAFNGSNFDFVLERTSFNSASTSTNITSSANPSIFGQPVIFTATVSANVSVNGTPTGMITFLDGANPMTAISLNGTNVATFTTSSLSAGSHAISSIYSGDSNFGPSTSQIINISVNTPSLASYPDMGCTTPCSNFAFAVNHVYIKGTDFIPGSYRINYYDGNGVKRFTQEKIPQNGTGLLFSDYSLKTEKTAAAGIWHVLVQPSDSYTNFGNDSYATIMASQATYGLIANGTFSATSTAIPEFSTNLSIMGVAIFCGMVFWWIRKKVSPPGG